MPHVAGMQLGSIGGGGGGSSITAVIVSDVLDSGGQKNITGISTAGKIVIPVLYSDPVFGSLRVPSTTGTSALISSDAGLEHAGEPIKVIVIG